MERVLLDVTYTGNQTRNVWIPGYAENPAVYIPGNCVAGQYGLTAPGPCSNTSANNRQARSVLNLLNPTEGPKFGFNTGGNHTGVTMASMDGSGHYNGLKIGLSKRLSSGWSANANYTISKCINQGEPATDIGWNLLVTPQAPDYKVVPDFKLADGHMRQRSPPSVQPELRPHQSGSGQWSGAYDHEGLASRPDLPGAQRFAAHAYGEPTTMRSPVSRTSGR